MPGVVELILAEHRRIRRLFASLDRAASPAQAPCPQTPEPIWARLAEILALHIDAEHAICFSAMFAPYNRHREEIAEAVAGLDDIRKAIKEVSLHRCGCTAWWAAVLTAQRAAERHCTVTEQAALAAPPSRSGQPRVDLEQQWAALAATSAFDAEAPLTGNGGQSRSESAPSRPGEDRSG